MAWRRPRIGQRVARLEGIVRHIPRIFGGRVQGRDSSGRRKPSGESPGTRNRLPGAQRPRAAQPARPDPWRARLQRQDVADRLVQAVLKTRAPGGRVPAIVELAIERIDVDRQASARATGSTTCPRRPASDIAGRAPGARRALPNSRAGLVGPTVVVTFRGDQAGSVQIGFAVAAPVAAAGPARQRFRRDTICPGRSAARRPGRSARAAGGQVAGHAGAWSAPMAAVFHSSPSTSSIETKVGSPPMVRRTSPVVSSLVDRLAQGVDRRPLLVGIGLGDARLLDDAGHPHVEVEARPRRVDARR